MLSRLEVTEPFAELSFEVGRSRGVILLLLRRTARTDLGLMILELQKLVAQEIIGQRMSWNSVGHTLILAETGPSSNATLVSSRTPRAVSYQVARDR